MNTATPTELYRPSPQLWALFAVMLAAVIAAFSGTFEYLYVNWQREEYSHGFLVPLISLYLCWQLRELPFIGSWAGVVLTAAGLGLYFVGTLAAITTIDAYALVVVIAGLLLTVMGWQAFRWVAGPVAMLLLMNPIPAFLFNNLSSALQLVSSQIGVAVIRLFGISVFLEGNVIDLGTYKLQVVEACSGLRYLFPLLTLGVIVACMVNCRLWIRLVLVLSTMPITVLMNSFRIGMIGVLVDRFGIAQAEGFLHDFEGWVIFMACFALLLGELWLLLRLSGNRSGIRDIIAIEQVPAIPAGSATTPRKLTVPAYVAAGLLLAALIPAFTLPQRVEIPPKRQDFTSFPLTLGDWQARRTRIYLDVLKLDDYILADYVKPGSPAVNFYVAYYASQRTGASAHSPAACLPGSGWRMSDFALYTVPGVQSKSGPLRVNRVIIQQGEGRQLVYYWFQERHRIITNEYLVKWYLMWDGITLNRSDGALIRFVTPIGKSEEPAVADARMAEVLAQATHALQDYLPE
jgi:exosortase D (VPLPA-CTERM-specific)